MTSVLALGLLWSGQSATSATFADAWDRWKRVDAAWSLTDSKPRQALAIPHLKAASGQLYASRWSDACAALDEAAAHLEGRQFEADMAVSLRFRPPVAEPGKPARLQVSWAYRRSGAGSFPLRIGNRRLVVYPNRNLTVEVLPGQLEPELAGNPELGVPLTATVGTRTRTIVLSILKSARPRVQKLLESTDETVRALGMKALAMLEAPVPAEPASSLLSIVSTGEALMKGTAKLDSLRILPFARHQGVGLQLSQPPELERDASGKVTLVVGISGFGGEAGFFEALGQGSAPVEANRRGWIFVGASPSANAVRHALDWVQTKLGKRVGRIFAIGYGTGAESALAANMVRPPTVGVALISPVNAEFLRAWADAPLYIAAGAEDANRVLSPLQALARELAGKSSFKYEEFENCEHLTVAAEAVAKAFAFFDVLKP